LDLFIDLQDQIGVAAQILPPSRTGTINNEGDAVSVLSELLQPQWQNLSPIGRVAPDKAKPVPL
jgi:hypothetical protein